MTQWIQTPGYGFNELVFLIMQNFKIVFPSWTFSQWWLNDKVVMLFHSSPQGNPLYFHQQCVSNWFLQISLVLALCVVEWGFPRTSTRSRWMCYPHILYLYQFSVWTASHSLRKGTWKPCLWCQTCFFFLLCLVLFYAFSRLCCLLPLL